MNIVQLVNAWLIVMRNKVGSSVIQLMNEKANCYLSFNFFYISCRKKSSCNALYAQKMHGR